MGVRSRLGSKLFLPSVQKSIRYQSVPPMEVRTLCAKPPLLVPSRSCRLEPEGAVPTAPIVSQRSSRILRASTPTLTPPRKKQRQPAPGQCRQRDRPQIDQSLNTEEEEEETDVAESDKRRARANSVLHSTPFVDWDLQVGNSKPSTLEAESVQPSSQIHCMKSSTSLVHYLS